MTQNFNYREILNKITLRFQSGAPLNRFELFGEVYANVLSSFQIVSSGIFFDNQAYVDHEGTTWDLFAPFAYKPTMANQVAEAIDMSIKGYRNYTEQSWFRLLKVTILQHLTGKCMIPFLILHLLP